MGETLVCIVNHNQTETAIKLRQQFAPLRNTLLLDSGSNLNNYEKKYFDHLYPNIYYNGLLNKTHEFLASNTQYDKLLFITGDVKIIDPEKLISKMEIQLNAKCGIYAPSANHSGHTFMINNPTLQLQKVVFTEGFCFACRINLLDKLCPIDLTLNKLGYGTDVLLGYLSIANGLDVVVDHSTIVYHPQTTGYDPLEAWSEVSQWLKTFSLKTRFFYKQLYKNKNKVEPNIKRLRGKIIKYNCLQAKKGRNKLNKHI